MSYSVLLKLESASESPGCWLEGNLSTNESYRLRMKTKLCSSTLSFRAHSRILFSTLSMKRRPMEKSAVLPRHMPVLHVFAC
nr:uncharacterized protein LOC112424645 isoform X2 [Macaca nemestrina]